MQAWTIIRREDMKPVLECWDHELRGRITKPEFWAMPTLQWLQGFNRAVKIANGNQPDPDLIRKQF